MKYLIIGLILAISPFYTFGHNPLSARYHLEAGENASILSINLSQDGVNQLLLKKYNAEEIHQLEAKALKERIVDYIKTNFELFINGAAITLTKGGIKLGSHQTDLKFVLPALPTAIDEFYIRIPAFQENDHHQTIFSYRLAGVADKVILSKHNDFQSEIRLKEEPNRGFWSWSLWGGLLMGSVVFWVWRF